MSRILSLLALFFFVAFPIASNATPVPADIHRMGGKTNPVGGAIRDKDWHMQGDMVHASHTKGLSLNTQHPGTPKKGEKVWSISDHHFANHPEFKVAHDGKDKGGTHRPGHASLHYIGEPIHKDALKTKLTGLPWHKRSLGENARYKRSVMAEKAYRREQLENAYRRALEELD